MTERPKLPPSTVRILVPFGLGVLLAGVAAWLWWSVPWTEGGKTPPAGVEERFTEAVLSGLPKLVERWKEGDKEGHYGTSRWACPELPASPHVAPGFLQCNPHYLECWARGLAGAPAWVETPRGRKLRLRAVHPEVPLFGKGARHGRWVTRAGLNRPHVPRSGLWVEVEVEGMAGSWPVVLEDVCRGVQLPVRRYGYGPRPGRHERVTEMDWDNEGRRLWLDKYPVSRADVNQWVVETRSGAATEKDPARWALPALGLDTEQQTSFCAWHGKRRMEAHLWDAGTMLPGAMDRPFPEFLVRSWLPWTRDPRGTFFERASSEPDWSPSAADCALAYVKECEGKFPFRAHQSDNVSWIGLYHVLGGEAEAYRNPVEPTLILRYSSRHLAASSPLHQLGRRGPIGESAPAFRCFLEEFP